MQVPEAIGATVPARVWHTLLTLSPSNAGPVAVRHAPFLATGALGAEGEPMSSILYPAGMRRALLESFGRPAVAEDGDGTPGGYERHRLDRDVARFPALAPLRQAQVLACLNCITEQHVAVRLAQSCRADHFDDPAGCHVLYEAARAMARLRPRDQQSRTVLSELVARGTSSWVRAAAGVQLAAARVRIDADVAAAGEALGAVDRHRRELDRASDAFAAELLDSRYARLEALLAVKEGDPRRAAAALDVALASADALLDLPASPYRTLVAVENRKIVLEAHLKAAGGARNAAAAARWAIDLLALDPDDAYTWRYVATQTARCGLATEAALAAAGVAAVGGLGVVEALAAVRGAARGTETSPELTGALLDALERLHDPGAGPSAAPGDRAPAPVALADAGR